MEWRVLVVDDTMADDVAELVQGHKVLTAPDSILCETCADFTSAIRILAERRFDLIILDVKDETNDVSEVGDAEVGTYAGERIYKEIKMARFLPIVFHTGFPHKVKSLESPFVRVVAKGENVSELRTAIRATFDTKLPQLVKHIEEEQRKYMWESAEQIWTKDINPDDTTDLVYLLARRLANLLQGDVVRNFLMTNESGNTPQTNKLHAVELYVWPPVTPTILFGDILKKIEDGKEIYFVVLTPSCDCAQGNAEFVLLAKCRYLTDTAEWSKVKTYLDKKEAPSKTAKSELIDLFRDKSTPVDRFKYLPSTSFLPDLVIDFQRLTQVEYKIIATVGGDYQRVASLDNPFAEALQGKMTRYYGRIGTPDLDVELAYQRLTQ